MNCSKCNHQNQQGTKFCESCGNKLEIIASESCQKCGKPNLPNYKFCEFCGLAKNVGNEPTPQSQAEPDKTPVRNNSSPARGANNDKSTTTNGQKKSSVPWVFILIGVAIAAVAGYFVLGKSEKKSDPPKVISNPAKTNNAAQGIAEITPEAFYQQAKPYVLGMLTAMKNKNEKVLAEQIQNINALRKPNAGDRKNARHFNEAGLSALKQNNLEFAIANFNQAVEEDPTDQEATNNLGYAYYLNNDFVNARALLEYTLALAPQRTSAWANYGEVLFKQGMAENGINAYLIAYLYAKNQDRFVQYLEKQSKENDDTGLRNFYTQVLSAISKMK